MGNETIPDYTNYSAEELLDIYMNLDKQLNPEVTRLLEEELRKKMNNSLRATDKKTVILNFIKKKSWIAGFIFFILLYYLSQPSYAPGEQVTPGAYLYPALIHLVVLSILIFYANKGSILAGVLIALYFAYILFGRIMF